MSGTRLSYNNETKGLAPLEDSIYPPRHQDYIEALNNWKEPLKIPTR